MAPADEPLSKRDFKANSPGGSQHARRFHDIADQGGPAPKNTLTLPLLRRRQWEYATQAWSPGHLA
jgi:hypothetical protein